MMRPNHWQYIVVSTLFLSSAVTLLLFQNCSRGGDTNVFEARVESGTVDHSSVLISVENLADLESEWRRLDSSMGLWYTDSDNKDDALLGNSQDIILSSYLAMFRGTQDVYYLNRFVQQMNIVLSKRDDFTGYSDYSGGSNPVWSTRKEGYVLDTSKAYGFLVESGNLIYPMADFAQMVIRGPEWLKQTRYRNETLLDLAIKFRQRALETYQYHMERFHTDTVDGRKIGWFSSRPDANFLVGLAPGAPYPLNYTTSMGRAIIMLWLAFDKTGSFLDTIQRIGNYVRLEMQSSVNDTFVWYYFPKMTYYPSDYVKNFGNDDADDIYHGAITIEFVYLLKKYSLGIFDSADYKKLANTFMKNIVIDPTNPSRINFTIDGAHPGKINQYLNEAGMFYYIAESNDRIPNVINDMLLSKIRVPPNLDGANSIRSLAHLIRYYREPALPRLDQFDTN